MSDAIIKANTATNAAVNSAQNSTTPSTPALTNKKDRSVVSQDQFLNLLVNQLKNQDPLNPMENDQFAVQLAQFSSLEQLTQINKKIDQSNSSGAQSLASYLGNEVTYADNKVRVTEGKGSNLIMDIPAGTDAVRVDLLDDKGQTVGSQLVEGLSPGNNQVIKLDGLEVANGSYVSKVVSVGANGRFVNIPAKATGTVEGFMMDPAPKLIVGGEEILVSEVKEVYKG
jgi:flagellar basal-body rod modification protein FlgD